MELGSFRQLSRVFKRSARHRTALKIDRFLLFGILSHILCYSCVMANLFVLNRENCYGVSKCRTVSVASVPSNILCPSSCNFLLSIVLWDHHTVPVRPLSVAGKNACAPLVLYCPFCYQKTCKVVSFCKMTCNLPLSLACIVSRSGLAVQTGPG